MRVIVLYFMNCLQIAILQDLTPQPTVNAMQSENNESITNDKSGINYFQNVNDEIHDAREVNAEHHAEYLTAPNPTQDKETNTDVSYPFNFLMRLLKVKGSITDGLDGASKIFGGVHDVGGELFGMVKDGALNLGSYLPFKI